ncbi:MAG TPA: Asp23/Gls24 family envelope stress response protein [Ktedonosporobacter sp.]|nr:Asp23/Gls24 family envelope stress response protein [Ktedonosporobacter sp.]
MAIGSQPTGVVRVARQVLSTIVISTALQIPGVVSIAHPAQFGDQWSRLLGRDAPRQGVALTVKDNTVSADLYIVVETGANIVAVGTAVQEEVASAIEEMIGMQVQEVNVYIQDVA